MFTTIHLQCAEFSLHSLHFVYQTLLKWSTTHKEQACLTYTSKLETIHALSLVLKWGLIIKQLFYVVYDYILLQCSESNLPNNTKNISNQRVFNTVNRQSETPQGQHCPIIMIPLQMAECLLQTQPD